MIIRTIQGSQDIFSWESLISPCNRTEAYQKKIDFQTFFKKIIRHSGGSRNPGSPDESGNRIFLDPGFRRGDGHWYPAPGFSCSVVAFGSWTLRERGRYKKSLPGYFLHSLFTRPHLWGPPNIPRERWQRQPQVRTKRPHSRDVPCGRQNFGW